MPPIEVICVIAGAIILYIIYLIVLSVIRKKASKTAKRNYEKVIQQQQSLNKDKTIKNRTLQNQYEETSNYHIKQRTHRHTGNEPMTYGLKQSVLTNREMVMYRILEGYCRKNKLVLLTKIRMADFIDTIDIGDQDIYDDALKNVWAKHVDFLICDYNDFRPKAAIEVDDSSHDSEDRRERDEFVDKVYNHVNLQIFHFRELNEEYIIFKLDRFFGTETVIR